MYSAAWVSVKTLRSPNLSPPIKMCWCVRYSIGRGTGPRRLFGLLLLGGFRSQSDDHQTQRCTRKHWQSSRVEERVRTSTPYKQQIVLLQLCVRARGACHIILEGNYPPLRLYILHLALGGRILNHSEIGYLCCSCHRFPKRRFKIFSK